MGSVLNLRLPCHAREDKTTRTKGFSGWITAYFDEKRPILFMITRATKFNFFTGRLEHAYSPPMAWDYFAFRKYYCPLIIFLLLLAVNNFVEDLFLFTKKVISDFQLKKIVLSCHLQYLNFKLFL